jgi:hypothetical protein
VPSVDPELPEAPSRQNPNRCRGPTRNAFQTTARLTLSRNSLSGRSDEDDIGRVVRSSNGIEIKMSDNNTVQGSGTAPVSAPATQGSEPTALNFREAYDKTLELSKTLAVDALLPVNVDLPTAVTTAVGAMPQILALRDRVKDELPKFDLTHFEQLEQYALAAAHSHGNFLAASAPPEALVELNTKGMALRDMLYTDAVALAGRGLISGDRIGDFKANVGYKNITFDLIGLASLLKQNWDKISSRTAIQMSELDAAEALAGQLVSALASREQAPGVVSDVAVQRQRNFTLFAQAYDQVRRAISYLRWDDEDLERVAPSLYGGRIVKSRKNADPAQPGTAPAVPANGSAAAGTAPSTVPATGTAASGTPATATHTPATPAAASNGLPGASPFAGVS